MSAQRLDPELVRKHLLDMLERVGGDLTTAELRQLLLAGTPGLVNETVYRNLVILERRGQVRRVRRPGRRHVAWAINTPISQPNDKGGQPR
ncbi:Fur family transcriptional regulator [Mycolicibacterium nivoides]|uniref:Fur family transcriptional regulator n=1 Tax=Mycolicibacterium nivoides TaxID=2487344 RepID=A0ABW9LKP4_9MYCO